jgi:hypothetical protein
MEFSVIHLAGCAALASPTLQSPTVLSSLCAVRGCHIRGQAVCSAQLWAGHIHSTKCLLLPTHRDKALT